MSYVTDRPYTQVKGTRSATLSSNDNTDNTNQEGTSSDTQLDQVNLRTASLGKAGS
jgi:hypothetical protein